FFFFPSRRRHTRWPRDWSSDVCSSDLPSLSTCEPPPFREACGTAGHEDAPQASRKGGGSQVERDGQTLGEIEGRGAAISPFAPRSEERRVGKECGMM